MEVRDRTRLAGLALATVLVAACGASGAGEVLAEPAVTVEEVEGSEIERLTLSPSAALRLGIELAIVEASEVDGQARTTIPYAAVLYHADGQAWVYTSPEDRVFVRHAIDVVAVDGDRAILATGPPTGTRVVTVGVAELHGVEAGVGGGH